jgi:hypothetical protein
MCRILSLSALTLALLASVTPAWAQSARAARPYRGLFGAGDMDASHMLFARASLGVGFTDDLSSDVTGDLSRPRRHRQGGVGSFSGSLSYGLQSPKFSIGAAAMTGARYYPSLEGQVVRSSSAAVRLGVPLWRATSFSADASVVSRPHSFGGLFPGADDPALGAALGADFDLSGAGATDEDSPADNVLPTANYPTPSDIVPGLDYAVSRHGYLAYAAGVGISHRIDSRTSVRARYGYRTIRGRSVVRGSVGGQFSRAIARGLTVRAGYRYAEAKVGDREYRPHHVMDGGINYSRPLSLSRNTTLSFSTGSYATRRNDRSMRVGFTGSARLNHELGRSWSAFAAYGRRARLDESFDDLIVGDGVSAGVGGLLSRRVHVRATTGASLGSIGIEGGAPAFSTVHANAALGYALARFANLSVTYSYYRHRFGAGTAMPLGLPSALDRQSVQINVSVWAPLFQAQ